MFGDLLKLAERLLIIGLIIGYFIVLYEYIRDGRYLSAAWHILQVPIAIGLSFYIMESIINHLAGQDYGHWYIPRFIYDTLVHPIFEIISAIL